MKLSMRKWWSLITPHLYRCRVLVLSAFYKNLTPLEQPLPLLQDLVILKGSSQSSLLTPDMLQNMPLLRSLRLDDVGLLWCLPAPSNIVTIKLEECKYLPLIVFIEMLHASPALDVLKLTNVKFDLRHERHGTLSLGPIYLEKLRILALYGIEPIPISVILGTVRPAPSCNIYLRAPRYQTELNPQEIPGPYISEKSSNIRIL
jgi:hypothetical protein